MLRQALWTEVQAIQLLANDEQLLIASIQSSPMNLTKTAPWIPRGFQDCTAVLGRLTGLTSLFAANGS
ncbi:hypothetical protein [Bradyrhizobium sp. SEMIA]|uniref:hypothetical protein n=1 Tax=Bradyrhizobium sp. SEMIA TaxID=2597515 RepID=UPI0018A4D2D9|nr:hypothetical protein [Bradyrhizobium sp. SEMIA]QOG21079.1 hypothetical protein FOM02_30935 [Bradyrhizobium sp. SEMIA]